jgi:hypothetical protein
MTSSTELRDNCSNGSEDNKVGIKGQKAHGDFRSALYSFKKEKKAN